MDRPAVGAREDEAVIVSPAGAQPLLELLAAPGPQYGDGAWVEVDGAPAVRRLHVGDVGAVLDRQDLLVDDSRAASRSTLRQGRPSTSPRRIPVLAAR